MALLLKADGTITEVKPENGKHFTLEELQKYVGGDIQLLKADPGKTLVCNEDGKRKGLPFNPAATLAYRFGTVDHIVGDALVITDSTGELR